MASIHDWATNCAARIKAEPRSASVDRIAAIIATFAEPLMKALREAKIEHHHSDDSFYCCPKCDHFQNGEPLDDDSPCDCGAEAHNARIDAALAGLDGPAGGPTAPADGGYGAGRPAEYGLEMGLEKS